MNALEEGELTPEMELALHINQSELQEKAINYAYAIKSIEDVMLYSDFIIVMLRLRVSLRLPY